MTPQRLYRFCIWLPLFVPAAVIVVMNVLLKGLGMPRPSGWLDYVLEIVGGSLLIGGLPYLALALWASWWIKGRQESQIRQLMYVAPVLMLVLFFVVSIVMGLVSDRPGVWTQVMTRYAAVILALGYSYVGVTVALRRILGPRLV
jgi:hypothetical protein